MRLAAIAFATALVFSAKSPAQEGFDYSLGIGARTVPKGASLNAETGYGLRLWGTPGDGQINYGYLRPVARGRTSLIVNAAEAELQIAPISFLIFSAGAGASSRSVDTSTVDCVSADCRGVLGWQFISGSFFVGAGSWVAGTTIRASWLKPVDSADSNRDFADEDSALAGKNGGDRLLTRQLFLLWKMNSDWSIGGFTSTQEMSRSTESNRSQGVFVRRRHQDLALTAGLSLYESSLQERTPSLFAAATWTGRPSIGLH